MYEGNYRDDQRNGKGTLYYIDGGRIEGTFLDGVAHGRSIKYFYPGKTNNKIIIMRIMIVIIIIAPTIISHNCNFNNPLLRP